jgi:hypothetical protein
MVEWNAFTEQTTARLKKESAAAEKRISRLTKGKGAVAASEARGMSELQRSIAVKYANADAVKIITDAEVGTPQMARLLQRSRQCAALVPRP